MSCCGRSRSIPARPASRFVASPAQSATTNPSKRISVIVFEYVGNTALTAIGAVSGRRYRFARPFARQAVDPRDRPSLAQVPNLRFVT